MISALGFALVLFALGFFPLLGGPRYEAALLAGLVGPTWALVTVGVGSRESLLLVRDGVLRDQLPRRVALGSLVLKAGVQAGLFILGMLVVAVVHGVASGPCEPVEGTALLLLGPGMGLLLASLVGVMLGVLTVIVSPKRSRVLLAVLAIGCALVPVVSALVEVWAFYSTPVVYAYDEFAGYFAGPLYDATEFELPRLLSFRVGTTGLSAALAAALCALQLSWDRDARLRVRLLEPGGEMRARAAPSLWLAVFGIGLWAAISAHGVELGHRGNGKSIRESLGRTTARSRCRVHFSREVPAPEATRLARECEGHLSQLGRYFEVQVEEPVDVYLFANQDQKRRMIGAGRTNVAKPWRREIYIRPAGFPHPILGHELAHVVTAQFGQGPFRIAGIFGGWIPDPGRVEGFAEAAAVRESSAGTLREWAAAMRQVEKMPALRELFRLSFFGNSAARSYTAAGAFVDFLRVRRGPEVLKKWYRGESLQAAAGASLEELERDFQSYLDETEVPEEVLSLARPRFSRPGVFERRCPHAVDRLLQKSHELCGTQPKKARRLVREAVALDPVRAGAELMVPRCDWWAGGADEAEKEYGRLLEDEVRFSPPELRGAWEELGDLRWNAGRKNDARQAYERALSLSHARDVRRQVEVKLWGLSQPGRPEMALRYALAPSPDQQYLPALLLSKWLLEGPHEETAAYLLSRLALFSGRSDEAQKYGEQYRPKDLPLPSLRREAARTQLLISCDQAMKTGKTDEFSVRLKSYRELALSAAETLELERLAERCTTAEATR